jgi:hypothetical protein
MMPFLSAVVIAVALAVGASFVLEQNFRSDTHDRFTTSGARITAPGDNLVRF